MADDDDMPFWQDPTHRLQLYEEVERQREAWEERQREKHEELMERIHKKFLQRLARSRWQRARRSRQSRPHRPFGDMRAELQPTVPSVLSATLHIAAQLRGSAVTTHEHHLYCTMNNTPLLCGSGCCERTTRKTPVPHTGGVCDPELLSTN